MARQHRIKASQIYFIILNIGIGICFASGEPAFAQQLATDRISPRLAKPPTVLVPEICLSNGRRGDGLDVIMVPEADTAAYEARGLARVSCGNLDRRLYRDRICRAAYSGDEMQPLREYGRTVGEVRSLCDAANKVLGPPAMVGSSAHHERGN